MNVYETYVCAQYVVGRYIWYVFIVLMYICEKVLYVMCVANMLCGGACMRYEGVTCSCDVWCMWCAMCECTYTMRGWPLLPML